MKNPYPEQRDTHERQGGGHTSATGEKHDQKKAKAILAEKRFAGAENTTLENSTGRVSSDKSRSRK
jgi:hypothetical protein